MREQHFVTKEEFVKMSKRCDELEQQLRRVEELLCRGFGQMAESKDVCVQIGSKQVTQTVKSWNQERKSAKEKQA